MPKEELFLGYQTNFPGQILPSTMLGIPVKIPVFHTLIAGQTQMSGKTCTARALITQAVALGYKILLFDCKSQLSEFPGFGEEVPICLRETTDSLTILGLLESIMGRKLSMQYATLTRVSENAKTFKEVLKNAEELEENSRQGFVKDAARVLVDLMKRLITQTEGKKTTPKLELPYSINKITMNEFDLEGQQMILKTAFEDALSFPKLIIFLDEANKFIPQKYRSACDRAIFHYVTQGAVTKDFLWISTQYLATTNKDAMKAMDVRLLGRQSHATECVHTIDYVPKLGLAQKIGNDSVMQLKVGHFITVADNWVKCVYVCPENAERRDCQEVAMGKRRPEEVRYRFSVEGLFTSEELTEVKKLETKKKGETIEKKGEVIEIERPEHEVVELEPPPTEIISLDEPMPEAWSKPFAKTADLERVEKQIASLKKLIEQNATAKPSPNPLVQNGLFLQVADLHKRVENISERTEDLAERFKPIESAWIQKLPEGVTLEQFLSQVHARVHISPSVKKQVNVTTDDIRGKLLMLAKEGFFKTWHPLRDVVKAVEDHNWTADYEAVKRELASLAADQLFAMKKAKGTTGENMYSLCPYVEFTNEEAKQ